MKNKLFLLTILATGLLAKDSAVVGEDSNVKDTSVSQVQKKSNLPDEDRYQKLLKLLETKDSAKEATKKEDSENVQVRLEKKRTSIQLNDFDKVLLPNPVKSIIIGDKIIVYAEYNEKGLSDKAAPNNFPTLDSSKTDPLINPLLEDVEAKKLPYEGLNKSDITFNKHLIKLRKGDIFGKWEIISLSSTVVIYHNIKTNEFIKKFY